jgi:UDP-N-acetylglucosamine 2-epimerase (non-hydrolysing)
MFKILLAFGTRPEAIKLASVHAEITRRSDRLRLVCCVTGQHRELLDSVLNAFDMRTDYDLRVLRPNQTLFHITVEVLERVGDVLEKERPDLLVVQGDTTSAFASALAAFYLRIPVAHVEAGLRSYDRFQPYPEEANRTFISRISDLHFCPTARAAENLIAERVDPAAIHIVGNTVIDALLSVAEMAEAPGGAAAQYVEDLRLPPGRMILVTGHRRENFTGGLAELSHALVDIVDRFPDVSVVYAIHPNPNVARQVERILSDRDRIKVIPPPDYFRFVALMLRSYLIVTDSGGIQEEAPSLHKPVLIVRNVTERPEAVECGAALLVGPNRRRIVEEAGKLLDDPDLYRSMIVEHSPFGDGKAAFRIVDETERFLAARLGPTGSPLPFALSPFASPKVGA